MKKYIYLLIIFIFVGLFIASPYIIDYWQYKSALEAAGGMSVFEGIKKSNMQQCKGDCKIFGIPFCCSGNYGASCGASMPPACIDYEMQVTQSAGGQKCATGYLLMPDQYGMAQGAQNIILGGTTCTNLAVVASENGCVGCAAASINNPKVYAFKNKMKKIVDFIIAGSKSINN